jgi:hypothetical protein
VPSVDPGSSASQDEQQHVGLCMNVMDFAEEEVETDASVHVDERTNGEHVNEGGESTHRQNLLLVDEDEYKVRNTIRVASWL